MKLFNKSLIYYNIHIYRLVMNFLYAFHYRRRFQNIINLIDPHDSIILELCFGDIFIAEFCRKTSRAWMGYDLNESFVRNALKKGFKAFQSDIEKLEKLPDCDLCIMIGSLYHFYPDVKDLFKKIRNCSKRFILSEPVKNLTHKKGVVQLLSRLLTNAGKGEESFRFNESSLIETIEKLKIELKYQYRIISNQKDMILEMIW